MRDLLSRMSNADKVGLSKNGSHHGGFGAGDSTAYLANKLVAGDSRLGTNG
jgi:hypothetical protein